MESMYKFSFNNGKSTEKEGGPVSVMQQLQESLKMLFMLYGVVRKSARSGGGSLMVCRLHTLRDSPSLISLG